MGLEPAIRDLLIYSSTKNVKIKDKRLAILHLLSTFSILVYIAVVLFRDQQYLYRETPVGTVRLSVKAPSTKNASLLNYCSGSSLPYVPKRLLLPCVDADENTEGYQATSLDSIYLPTRVNLSFQAVPSNCSLNSANSCGFTQINQTAYYTANAEKWTFKISSMARAPTLKIQGSSADVKVRIANCPDQDGQNPRYKYVDGETIFTLEEILGYSCFFTKNDIQGNINYGKTVSIGTNLEQASDHPVSFPQLPLSPDPSSPTFESVRYAGAIITLAAEFDNTLTYSTDTVSLTYRFTRIPRAEYKTQFGFGTGKDGQTRTVFSSHGIIIIASIQGVFAAPRFQTFLVNITSGLGLLALSTFLVEFIMLYIVKEKKIYEKQKNSDPQKDMDEMQAAITSNILELINGNITVAWVQVDRKSQEIETDSSTSTSTSAS